MKGMKSCCSGSSDSKQKLPLQKENICDCLPEVTAGHAEDSMQWNLRYFASLAGLAALWLAVYFHIEGASRLLVFDMLGLTGHIAESLAFFFYDTMKILLLLTALIYGIAWLRASLRVERVRDYLAGKRRGFGYFMGALFGSVTPFCSCSSIPLFLGFLMARIPFGVVMAFLITSPLINEIAVVLLWGLLGWKFTVLYVVAGMAAGIAGGFFMDAIKAERWLPPFIQEAVCGVPVQQPVAANDQAQWLTFRQRHIFACDEMRAILRRTWKWVVIGVGIGAALHGFVPENWFANHLGDGEWWTVPVAVMTGIPLYANVTGIVPVMESLLLKGLPLGTTMAFCMSAVAASIPEVMMLRQIMTVRLQATFIGYLWVIFTLAGWLFNMFGSSILR